MVLRILLLIGTFTGLLIGAETKPSIAIVISPNPVRIGEPVTFTATSDREIACSWLFGDYGLTLGSSSQNPATYRYASSGGYDIFLNATAPDGAATSELTTVVVTDPALDADGDAVPDAMETEFGTDPNDTLSTPAPLRDSFAPMFAGARTKLNSNRIGTDSLSLTSDVYLPGSFSPINSRFAIYVGGLLRTYEITKTGKKFIVVAKSPLKHERISVRQGPLTVKVSFTLTHGDLLKVFQQVIPDFNASAQSGFVRIPIFMLFDDRIYARSPLLNFSVRNGVFSGRGRDSTPQGR